jgi:hypothetical protein
MYSGKSILAAQSICIDIDAQYSGFAYVFHQKSNFNEILTISRKTHNFQ